MNPSAPKLSLGRAMAALRERLRQGRTPYTELKAAVRNAGLALGHQMTDEEVRDLTQDARDNLVRLAEVCIVTTNVSNGQHTVHALTEHVEVRHV